MKPLKIIFLWLWISLIYLCITGCLGTNLNIYEGTFQVIKPPILSGNSKEIEYSNKHLSVFVNYGENKTKQLTHLKEEKRDYYYDDNSLVILPDYDLDIAYRIIETTMGGNYLYTRKGDYWFIGGNVGLAPFPYVAPTIGINTKHFEVGIYALGGISISNVSVSGFTAYQSSEGGFFSNENHVSTGGYKGGVLHGYGSLAVFSSVYYDRFSLGYSGIIAWPGVVREINEYDILFEFPYILQQSIEIGYLLTEKYDIKIGTSQIVSKNFAGRSYSANLKIGYTF